MTLELSLSLSYINEGYEKFKIDSQADIGAYGTEKNILCFHTGLYNF